MKKIFPLLLAALFAVQAKSQITFNRSDWTKVVGDDTELYRAVDPYAVPLPSEGPNQIWDYSGVAFNTGTTYYLDYDSVSFPPSRQLPCSATSNRLRPSHWCLF